jgi:hypothetical protein
MRFTILDEREIWHGPAIAAAIARGYDARRVKRGAQVKDSGGGIGFIRPHAIPEDLEQNQEDFQIMQGSGLTMIQDELQMALYEDKSAQWQFFGQWMPPTWRFARLQDAMKFLDSGDAPSVLVSKADVGASSVNVRILDSRAAQYEHFTKLFGEGIEVNHCGGGTNSIQQGYALLQEFIPHEITWRVNIVGTKLAAFKRYCYPDRPVAQTGNVEPVTEMTPEIESLFDFAKAFFREAGTHWCAADILKDGDKWRLLETSLAWPWPSPGDCNQAPFFETDRKWIQIWDVMFDEFEKGVWS